MQRLCKVNWLLSVLSLSLASCASVPRAPLMECKFPGKPEVNLPPPGSTRAAVKKALTPPTHSSPQQTEPTTR